MKNIHERKIIIIICIICVAMTMLLIIISSLMKNKETVVTSSDIETLSNKKIEWGIKRASNHQQPDLGSVNKSLMDKYNGMAMGGIDSKNVYLTFDMGYEAGYTEKILEVLKQNDVKAAFFITAHYVNSQPELVKRMIDEGHIVGNHTVNHKSLPSLNNEQIKEEIMNLHTAIFNKFNYEMKYMRPPKGEYSERSLAYCNTLGYTTVMWSFAYDDWDENKQGREDYAKKKIIDNIHNGAIILLHGTSKDNSNILDYCIKEIKEMGYKFTSLDEFE